MMGLVIQKETTMPTWLQEALPYVTTWGIVLALDFFGAFLSIIFTDDSADKVVNDFQMDVRMATRVVFVIWILTSVQRDWF